MIFPEVYLIDELKKNPEDHQIIIDQAIADDEPEGDDMLYLFLARYKWTNPTVIKWASKKAILDQLFAIIQRREAWKKEGKAIDKLESIYEGELASISKQLHRTADGTILIIQNMTDDHLRNTVKMILRKYRGDFKQIPKQYLTEVKNRPGMLEELIDYEVVIEQEEFSSEFDKVFDI